MRKSLKITASIILLSLLVFTGCKKEVAEPGLIETSEDNAASENLRRKYDGNSCRLVSFDWSANGFGIWQFHYNDKGLADEWIIDYGPFTPLVTNSMTYDNNNRLVKSIENFFGTIYEYTFYYTGKRMTRLTRINVDVPEDAFDFTYTYNSKGQITRQDDYNADVHVLMYYDVFGNCTRTDVYLGSDLYFSDNYTFFAAVKNPKLYIPGVETGFPFYGTGGLPDRWLFTSNTTVIYDNGTPIFINDYDPSQTAIKTGNRNLPSSASYYDKITEGNIDLIFEYDNCHGIFGGNHNGHSHGNKSRIATGKTAEYPLSLLKMGSSKSIKEKVQKLGEQYRRGSK